MNKKIRYIGIILIAVALLVGQTNAATVLFVPQGGTGVGTLGNAGVLIGNGTAALHVTTAGSAGEVLTSNGAGVDPTFQAVPGTGDITAVGDCATAACFTGTDGTTLTFNNAGGDKTLVFDGSTFTFNDDVVGTTFNALTLTSQAVGFTIAGGTTSKTLTVALDATVSGTNTGDNTVATSGDSPTDFFGVGSSAYVTGGTDVAFADGGTGISSWTQYLIPYAATTTSIGQIAIGTSGQILTSNGAGAAPTFQNAAAAGANTALSNLASVAINTTLLSDTDNTDALGTTAIAWSDIFLGSGAVITFNSAPSTPDLTLTHSAETLTFAGGTIALGTATATGGLTGNVTGNVTGTAATVTGSSQTAITTASNLVTVGDLTAGSIGTGFVI